MYDGKQVVRVENNYKQKDLYNIGVEMSNRKGTGNYDKERKQFNVEYVSLNERNLYQEVKQTLKRRNIEYLNKPNTNMLNGITFSSGPEFFETLGMKFIDSGRTYRSGDKEGQAVKIPYIKSKEDIPPAVTYYFDCCMEYLKDFVGEENIILAQVHYDEDTPHLQAYFIPVVNEVERKCYVKDKDGNVVKEEYTNKKGEITKVPKLLRDDKGKIVYEKVKGKFLNNDWFWKTRGGLYSFAKMQDSFNEFITEKGFNLYRGDIGSNKENQTKLEYQIKEKQAELEALNKEKENTLDILEKSKNALINVNKSVDKDILNPKKTIVGYNSNDVEKMINYSKNLEKVNIIQSNDIATKDKTIKKLTKENEIFRNNKELKKRNDLIKEQKTTIDSQTEEIKRLNGLVEILNKSLTTLKENLEKEITKWKNLFNKMCEAFDKFFGREPSDYYEDYEDLADSIIYDYYDKDNDKDDFEIGM